MTGCTPSGFGYNFHNRFHTAAGTQVARDAETCNAIGRYASAAGSVLADVSGAAPCPTASLSV